MVMVGLVYSFSTLIAHQVFLTERIDSERPPPFITASSSPSSSSLTIELTEQKEERMHHLKAVVFIRPSPSSLAALRLLLSSHRFAHFHLYFTAQVPDDFLRQVADADRHYLVESVHEYYVDFYALHPHLFHLNVDRSRPLFAPYSQWMAREKALMRRQVDGLCAVLLALKKQPEVRYVDKSDLCRRMAGEVWHAMQEERELFTFGAVQSDPPPLLLLLDRRNDPITPLLLQWTYTAMAHELLTIRNNRVDLSATPHIHKELNHITLSADSDHFYKGSMWLNFGDLGQSIKDLVSDFQRKVRTAPPAPPPPHASHLRLTHRSCRSLVAEAHSLCVRLSWQTKNHTKLDSIEAMQRFVDHYPEFRSLSGTVSKHVAVVSEMSRMVEQRRLMAVSEVEQELACNEDSYGAADKVERILRDGKVQLDDALRCVMLYALRYEGQENAAAKMRHLLREKAGDNRAKRRRVQLVDDVLQFAGAKVRSGDLYGNTKSFFARATQLVSGIRGVENIYTQHKPLLAEIIVGQSSSSTPAARSAAHAQQPHRPTRGLSQRLCCVLCVVRVPPCLSGVGVSE